MADMKVAIADHTGTQQTSIEMPDDQPLARLMPVLVSAMGLPLHQSGRAIAYVLVQWRTDRVLDENETLQSAGIVQDDVLMLVTKQQAGGRPQMAHRAVSAMFDLWRKLRQVDGQPPIVGQSGSRSTVQPFRPGISVAIADALADQRYTVKATSWLWPDRQKMGSLILPFSPDELEDILAELSHSVRNPRENDVTTISIAYNEGPTRTASRCDLRPPLVTEIGQRLFKSVFKGPLEDLYVETVAKATSPFPITIETSVPEVARMPWELLNDGERFLCTDIGPLFRVVPKAPPTTPAIDLPKPFKLLVVPTTPPGSIAINWQGEVQSIKAALGHTPHQIEVPDLQDVGSFMGTLIRFKPHVLHFIGHGDEDGNILFTNNAGQSVPVGEVLGQMVGAMWESLPRVIILNACGTGRVKPGAHDLGLAARLVRCRVPIVVAMQFRISDPAALAFARGFYDYIDAGRPIQHGADWGRLAIKVEVGETVEWAAPVVYANPRVYLGGKRPPAAR